MTDAEIIKALEACKNETCLRCPLSKEMKSAECLTVLSTNVLDLINSKNEYIKKCDNLERIADKTIASQKAEIERLKESKMLIANIEVSEDVLEKLINQKVISIANDKADVNFLCDKHIRTEAIKEFAERLKKAKQYSLERHENIVPVAVVDWIVKEMAGDAE